MQNAIDDATRADRIDAIDDATRADRIDAHRNVIKSTGLAHMKKPELPAWIGQLFEGKPFTKATMTTETETAPSTECTFAVATFAFAQSIQLTPYYFLLRIQ